MMLVIMFLACRIVSQPAEWPQPSWGLRL